MVDGGSWTRMVPGQPVTHGQWIVPELPMAVLRPECGPAPGCHPTSAPAFPGHPSQPLQQGLCLNLWPHVDWHLTASEGLIAYRNVISLLPER